MVSGNVAGTKLRRWRKILSCLLYICSGIQKGHEALKLASF